MSLVRTRGPPYSIGELLNSKTTVNSWLFGIITGWTISENLNSQLQHRLQK